MSLFATSACDNYLPIWLLHPNDVTQLGRSTTFQVIPNALIGYATDFCNGDIIKSNAYFPTMYEEPKNDEPIPYTLPSRIHYGSVGLENAKKLGWPDIGNDTEVYVYVLSRGIYRANTFTHHDSTQLVLSKYLGLQATRLRLAGEQEQSTSERLPSNILQMMYVGVYSGTIEFLLFNDSESIAIVRNLRAIIHDVFPRPVEPQPAGAALQEYQFDVTLHPDAKEILVTEQQFKYSPGDIDKFTIKYHSGSGYDYEVSLKLDWFDVRSGILRTIETPKEVARFPKYD